jgi:selenocysteine-specific elongation factor
LPVGRRVRVRGVQVHGASVERARSGQRTAVNLVGADVADIERGMMLAPIGRLRPTQIIDVQLSVLAAAPRSIRTRSRVRVHIGSAEVLARVRVLESSGEIAADDTGFAQLRFEKPVVALHDERFIIRSYSPAETIAGGLVLDPHATKHRGREVAKAHERLQLLSSLNRATKLSTFVEAAGDHGLRLADIAARTGWNDAVVSQIANQAQEGAAEPGITEAEGVLITTENFDRLCRTAVEEVKLHHQREPLSRGLPRETLRERHFLHAAPEIFRAVIGRLESAGALRTEKDLISAREHGLNLSTADQQLHDKIAQLYQKAGLEAPAVDQVFAIAGVLPARRAHGRKILQLLLDDGTLLRIHGEMFFHRQAIEQLKGLLRGYGTENEPGRLIDVAKFKELAGVSRKYAIPLLEYFDSERVTRRAGDKRIILK